jgi:hypothetical protein
MANHPSYHDGSINYRPSISRMQRQEGLKNPRQPERNSWLERPYAERIHETKPVDLIESLSAGRWGWLPLLSLTIAFGLMLVTIAFRASISGIENSDLLYWLGLLVLVVPATTRLASLSASRKERLALVIMLGMAMYGVKLLHSPAAFTYSDELVHYANANDVLRTQRLFGENSILPVTPSYPGLAAATAALSNLSGWDIFDSGLLLIGIARLVITLGLFLIYEKISASARVAGLGSVFYMANSNYLYWTAQYAYESLALPLAVFVIFLLTLHQEPGRGGLVRPAFLAAMLVIMAVTVTHHLTSYALATLLGLTALFSIVIGQDSRSARYVLWALALVATGVSLFWTLRVAPATFDYLFPVINRTFGALINVLTGGWEESGRELFVSTSSDRAPFWEQGVAIASVLLILAAIPFGLRIFWRRLKGSSLGWVFALAPLVYFPLQVLRLTGAGWETANRASEFLFIGIAFIVSLAFTSPRLVKGRIPVAIVTGIFAGILFMGGVIAGWPPNLRMSHPYYVAVKGPGGEIDRIEPQGIAAARWARANLGPANRMGADNSSARLMQAYGEQYALPGSEFGIHHLYRNESIGSGELEIIEVSGIEYLVFPHPLHRWNQLRGLFYNPAEGLTEAEKALLQPMASGKFDQSPQVDRLLDTGYVVIYDLRGLQNVETVP